MEPGLVCNSSGKVCHAGKRHDWLTKRDAEEVLFEQLRAYALAEAPQVCGTEVGKYPAK